MCRAFVFGRADELVAEARAHEDEFTTTLDLAREPQPAHLVIGIIPRII